MTSSRARSTRFAGRTVALAAVGLVLLSFSPVAAAVLRVDAANPAPGDGSTWATAYSNLQAALLAAAPGDSLWVAAGTYRPTTTPQQGVSFVIGDDVSLFGGFAGVETSIDARDPLAHPTILSGDIGTPGVGTDNSFRVVRIEGGTLTRLDGVTVTGGAGFGTRGTPTGTFAGGLRGGGVYVTGGQPTLHRVRFVANGSTDSGLRGGGFASIGATTDPLLIDVSFVDCSAERGGAMFANGAIRVVNVSFAGNLAEELDSIEDGGGAAYFVSGASASFDNVLAWGNTNVNLLGDQTSTIALDGTATATVATSSLEGSGGSSNWNPALGVDGGGNLDVDPQFVDASSGDLRLLARSPAIDAGDASVRSAEFDADRDGQPRVCGDAIDLGALEFQGVDCAPFDGVWSIGPAGADTTTGLPGDPFATLTRAVEVAASGDSIVFEPGTYAGVGFEDVDLAGKALTLRSIDLDPASVVIDFGGQPGIRFDAAAPDSTRGPVFRGITFANASRAIQVRGSFQATAPLVTEVTDCRLVGNDRGLRIERADARVLRTDFAGNTTEGLYGFASRLEVVDCEIRGSGVGLEVADAEAFSPWQQAIVRRTELRANEVGADFLPTTTVAVMESCVVDSNAVAGVVAASFGQGGLEINSTEITNNRIGLRADFLVDVTFADGTIASNDSTGVVYEVGFSHLTLERASVVDNGGWGVEGSSFAGRTDGARRNDDETVRVIDTTVRGNAEGGLALQGDVLRVENSLVVENGGVGLTLLRPSTASSGIEVVDVVGTTIADNLGDAFSTDHDSVVVARTLVTRNTGAAFVTTSLTPPTWTCTNVVDNASDFEGVLQDFEGVDGNVSLDPLFCDPAGGDYSVISISPCLADCGVIGAPGQGCSAEPVFQSILDIAEDQGGRVRLVWDSSHYDAPGSPSPITGYGVYRKQAPGQRTDTSRLLGWDFLATVPARGDEGYQFVADTLCDSTITDGDCWSTFFVSAATAEPLVFFDSAPDSGYSTDDLAPNAPEAVTVAYAPTENRLEWSPSSAEDLARYVVFRSDDPNSVPGPSDPVAGSTFVPSLVDTDFGAGAAWDFSYWVAAVDHAGNVSEIVFQETATDAPGLAPVHRVTLEANVPNPFNPVTEIAFGIVRKGPVSLRVFDTRGRVVRTLVDEVREAGRHRVEWDGRDDTGRAVASGNYFYRLRANGVDHARRMVLLK